MRPLAAPPDRLRARIAVLLAEPGVAERVRRRLVRRTPDQETAAALLPPGPHAPSAAAPPCPTIEAGPCPRACGRWRPDAREAADDGLERVAV